MAIFSGLFLIGYGILTWYVSSHNKELLESITAQLNENLNGTLAVESMDPTLLQGFPLVSLNLRNVTIRDSLYASHKHTLLSAADFNISVNTLAMLRGAIEIKKMEISNATIDLFTGVNGYTNTSVFKKSRKKPSDDGAEYPELRQLALKNVLLKIDNRHKFKQYEFKVDRLKAKLDYNSTGWNADVNLNTLVKTMAFSTKKGSFIKNGIVKGNLNVGYTTETSGIKLSPSQLEIGGEEFTIRAKFKVEGKSAPFAINIQNDKILWHKASALLSPNISSRLDMFSLSAPISVTCDIVGDLNVAGDPLIYVNAKIVNNTLGTPGGTVRNCSFTGEFTNNNEKSKGFNDANSAIKLYNFKGDYAEIPIWMEKTMILDLENPIAVGDFTSSFPISKLNNIVDSDLLAFTKGKADVKLTYTADIVNYKLAKPIVKGRIAIAGTALKYVPRNLSFNDISVLLNFQDDDLFISNIHLKTGKSVVDMEGSIKNFLNLYYTNPEKIVLNWDISSPKLYLGEFIGFLGSRKKSSSPGKQRAKGNFTEEVNTLLEKCNVNMNVKVSRFFFNNFAATNAKANILLNDTGAVIRHAGFNHAGGTISVNATLLQSGKANRYQMDAIVSRVNIREFFWAFDNFGQESLKAENIKGQFSTKANLSGIVTDSGKMIPNTMSGNVDFNLQKAALLNFSAIKNIGKLAFPNRNFNAISIEEINGALNINGEKVNISPMQVNSSVINMDINGIYSFGKGTEIYVAVPLRNPKRDKDITDETELAKRRNRGIVLNLIASDGDDGKVKIKLGKQK